MSTAYKVLVYTGDENKAGTNADVFITLYGENGTSSEFDLDNTDNNFEQGATDEFTLRMANLGQINQIKIRHDNSGIAPGWYLDKIIVDNPNNLDQGPWEFPCYDWLEGDNNAKILTVANKKVETT